MNHSIHPLREDLANREAVFRAPPFDAQLVNAIRLISPQFVLRADEASRKFWERNQNGACWGEFEALESLLRARPAPRRVLEVGPGLGRSVVFFTKMLSWAENTTFHLYEGEGTQTRYTMLGPRGDDSFCGNLNLLREVLEYNQIKNYEVFDAADARNSIRSLPGPYDLIYSFYSIGFHWSLEHFLDEILSVLSDDGLAIFTVPLEFSPFPDLERVTWRTVRFRCAWPATRELQLLILSRREASA